MWLDQHMLARAEREVKGMKKGAGSIERRRYGAPRAADGMVAIRKGSNLPEDRLLGGGATA